MIKRYENNPVLTAKDFVVDNEELEVMLAFNPGVIRFEDKVLLLVRVSVRAKSREGFVGVPVYDTKVNAVKNLYFDRSDHSLDLSDARFVRKGKELFLTTLSYLVVATSENGVDFKVENKPLITGDNRYEAFGVEDARITKIGDYYYINYSGVCRDGICTMLARTKDFVSVEKLGPIFMPDNKDVVIFPKKIKGKYVALSRPESAYFHRPNIWISYSDDLVSWGKHSLFMTLREDCFDSARIGASCVPFLTKYGWLEIYHGATENNKYCLGAVLLDKNDPEKIIARSDRAIMIPEASYEVHGFMPNVVFACGCWNKGDTVHLYYGACDESVCYARLSVKKIVEQIIK